MFTLPVLSLFSPKRTARITPGIFLLGTRY